MESDYLEAILRRYERENSIYRVQHVIGEPAVPAGENYLSTVTRVKAEVLLGSGAKRTVSVLVKASLQSEAGQWTKDSGVFNNEIKMFSNVLSKMTDLMHEFGDKRELLWANMIAHSPNTIIFEDLKEGSFRVTNRLNCLDLVHSKLVIRSLARMHAMSKILLQRCSISAADVQPYSLMVDCDFTNKVWGNGLKILCREMESWGAEWTNIRERLLKCSDTIAERLVKLNKYSENKLNVINHGDSWICNLMFKYDTYDKKTPIALKFVDFQLSHYHSLAWDLTYFLHTSLHGDFRRKYFKELVNDYFLSLKETLRMYNCPESEIPTLDDIHKELKQIDLYSLAICLLTHPVMTMPVENSYSLTEAMHPDVYENCGFNPEVFRGTYMDELGPDLKRFAEHGVI